MLNNRKTILLTLAYLFLSLFFFGGVFSQDILMMMQLEELPEKDLKAFVVRNPDEAVLIVKSMVPDLQIISNNQTIRQEEVERGRWNYFVKPGTHLFTFKAEGYLSIENSKIYFDKKSVKGVLIKVDIAASMEKARAENKTPGIVIIESDPDNAEVIINGRLSGTTPYQGLLSSGKYDLEVTKNLYISAKQEILVTPDETNPVKITLQPNFGFIEVKSTPSNANVYLDAKPVGTTPYKSGGLPAGKYSIEIRKDLYHPFKQEATVVNGQIVPVVAILLPAFGSLEVTSKPEGMQVYLDGKFVGSTPYSNKQMPSGQYELRVTAELVNDETRTVSISDGQPSREDFSMSLKYGTITIKSTPDTAKVYLDQKPVGNTPYSNTRLLPGQHTIKLQKELYHDFEETVNILAGKSADLDLVLPPAYGSLEVITTPSGMSMELDGKRVGLTPYRNEKLASGTYEIRLSGEMVREVTERITITDGKVALKDITMPKDYGTLDIDAESDVEVYIDGSLVGKGKIRKNVKAESHKIEGQKVKHNPDTQMISLSIGETKTATLRPEPRTGKLTIMVSPNAARDAQILINNEAQGPSPKIFPNILEGTYTIVLQKEGFLPYEDIITIGYQEEKQLTPTMLTYEGSRKQTRDRWSKKRNWTLVGTTLFASAAIGTKILANQKYDRYQKATTTDDAVNFRKQVNNYDNYSLISVAVGGVFATWTLYNQIRKGSVK